MRALQGKSISCLTVERTSPCTKRHGICGINDTDLHSKNVAIEFHGFISVSNLEDKMKSSPKRHLVANYGAPRNYGKQNVKKWHFRVIGTLGARGFSCAVSGVGHVSIVTRAKNLIFLAASPLVQCQRPSAAISIRRARKNLWYPGYVIGKLARKSGNFGLKSNGKVIFRKFHSEIAEYLQGYSSFSVRNGTAEISLPFANFPVSSLSSAQNNYGKSNCKW